MNPWLIDLAVAALFCSVALVLLVAKQFYITRAQYHRDLISRMVANRLSLVWDEGYRSWLVYGKPSALMPVGRLSGSPPIAQHDRWELAAQQALESITHMKSGRGVGDTPGLSDGWTQR